MRLNTRLLGFATAMAAAATFTICSIIVAMAPGALSAFVSYALHIDITGIARHITFPSFLVGVLFVAIAGGGFVVVVASVYNGFATRSAVRAAIAR